MNAHFVNSVFSDEVEIFYSISQTRAKLTVCVFV